MRFSKCSVNQMLLSAPMEMIRGALPDWATGTR